MASNSPADAKGNRARGWILAALGPILSLAMAVIGFNLWRIIHYPGQLGSHSRWNGSEAMTFNTFALFATIFVFGLICTVAGIFQIRTGRKNIVFLILIFALFAVMIYFGSGVMRSGQ
jgi:hypothetical protein